MPSWNLVADRYLATFPVTQQTIEDALYERPMGEARALRDRAI